jgi:toxin ParE1/3/4
MKIFWTEPCLEDLRAIGDYIARDSEFYAADLIEQIIMAVEALPRFPKMGRLVPEAQDPDVRELLHQTYRIIYRLAGESIEVLAVVHGSRDLRSEHSPRWDVR